MATGISNIRCLSRNADLVSFMPCSLLVYIFALWPLVVLRQAPCLGLILRVYRCIVNEKQALQRKCFEIFSIWLYVCTMIVAYHQGSYDLFAVCHDERGCMKKVVLAALLALVPFMVFAQSASFIDMLLEAPAVTCGQAAYLVFVGVGEYNDTANQDELYAEAVKRH